MKRKKKNLFSQYFKPSLYLRSYSYINLNSLKNSGIKVIICDLDNTLVPHFKRLPTRDNINWIDKIQKNGMSFVIVSNNTTARVKTFCEKAGVTEYYPAAKKPSRKIIDTIMKKHNVTNKEIIIIGDQVVTDVWVANRVHCESVLVQPLVSTDETMSKFNKILERFVYSRLEKNNIINRGEYNVGTLGINYDML